MAQYDDELMKKLKDAGKLVTVGGKYVHFKGPDKIYKVLDLAILEADLTVAVIYEPQYKNEKMRFIRPIENWLDLVDYEGKQVLRFTPLPDEN